MEFFTTAWADFAQIAMALVLLYLCSAVLLGPQLWPRVKRKQPQPIQHHQDGATLVADNT